MKVHWSSVKSFVEISWRPKDNRRDQWKYLHQPHLHNQSPSTSITFHSIFDRQSLITFRYYRINDWMKSYVSVRTRCWWWSDEGELWGQVLVHQSFGVSIPSASIHWIETHFEEETIEPKPTPHHHHWPKTQPLWPAVSISINFNRGSMAGRSVVGLRPILLRREPIAAKINQNY